MSTPSFPTESFQSDPATWLERYGDILYRHALLRVHRADVAEDLVQETFLAALGARQQFAQRSSERAWLLGILRHKIVDYFRSAARSQIQEEDRAAERDFFLADGRWKTPPRRWTGDPQAVLEQIEFWKVFEDCLSKLPRGLAVAFALRQLEEMETHDTCQALGITATNLFVRLHRARLMLRQCLEQNWFAPQG